MKSPHLLRVEGAPEEFATLFAVASAAGLRLGWLALGTGAAGPPALEAAAGLGALRAVAVGEGRSVAVKALAGEPVLRDLLREHFLGCAAVLVAGEGVLRLGEALAAAPRLAPAGEGRWRLSAGQGEAGETLGTEALLARLRSPLSLPAAGPSASGPGAPAKRRSRR